MRNARLPDAAHLIGDAHIANSHGRFLWYELLTTDVEASKSFYVDVMGWATHDVPIPGVSYTIFTAGETSIGGVVDYPEEARQSGARPGWLGYVGVEDVDAAAERVVRLGGAVHVSPRDVSDISRLSIVSDPQAVTFALFKWLKSGEAPSAEFDAPGRVSWHELVAADWEAAFAFYRELFGWQKAGADTGAAGTYQLFSAGGQTIGGMFTKPAMVPAPFWLYYFNVGDINAASHRVKAARGQILKGPTELPGGKWMLQCIDPLGAVFALLGHNGIGFFERAPPRTGVNRTV